MKNVLLAILFLGGSISVLLAQPIGKSSYETRVAVAAEKMAEKDYYNAVVLYEEAFEERKDEKLLPLIADLNLKLRDYAKAQRAYAQVLRKDKDNKLNDLRFNYARALKMNGQYEESIPEFQKFIAASQNDTLKELAQYEIAGAELALTYAKQDKKQALEPVSRMVNSAFSEYSPAFSREGKLYYAGFHSQEVIIADDKNQDYHAKIYFSTKDKDKGWGKPDSLDQSINRPGVHTSNVAFSSDGNRMFFTRSALDGNELKDSKIYYSVGGDGAWGPANELIGVNGEYISKNPAVGELFGKEVLFFSANMEGGYGGFDLYYATLKNDGVYGDPVNLGPKINTAADEVTPFYFKGTLYFSSSGHPGLGGQDIFYSVWNGTLWSEPKNMGAGFNSAQDDQFFTLDKDGYNGALTSNRPGGRSVRSRTCCDDIYAFEIEKIKADLVVGVFDNGRRPLNGATVTIIPLQQQTEALGNSKSNANGNRFDFPLDLDKAYKIVVTRPNYFPDSAQINTVGLKTSKIFENRFYLKPVPPPPPAEPEYDTITIQEAIVLENILYDFDDDKIKKEAETDLNLVLELMNKYPEMEIELSSHTDNRGNDAYNQGLSQRRAESAKRWLVGKGVKPERIAAKGYGESQPKIVSGRMARLDTNLIIREGDTLTKIYIDSLPSEELQELAHSMNRRTEFKITKGPTSITIKRTSLRKQPANKTQPNRNRNIGAPVDTVKPGQPIIIHELSTLKGRKDLKGVPIMQFAERVIDFGAVKKGEKREHTYEFTNLGDTPLEIAVISACDCTTTEYSTDPVPPGGKGKIQVIFDSTEKDHSEVIDVDIILKNTEPDTGRPIIERLKYSFTLRD